MWFHTCSNSMKLKGQDSLVSSQKQEIRKHFVKCHSVTVWIMFSCWQILAQLHCNYLTINLNGTEGDIKSILSIVQTHKTCSLPSLSSCHLSTLHSHPKLAVHFFYWWTVYHLGSASNQKSNPDRFERESSWLE